MKKILSFAGPLFALLGTLAISCQVSAGPGFKVLEPGIRHFGKSYNELTGEWWSWAIQFPLATNPIVEDGPVDCTRGQKGKIWFLAGTFGETAERSCTIPKGKALFFSALNGLYWYPEDGDNVDEVRANFSADVTPTLLDVSIDGVSVADPYAYRVQSQPGGFALKYGPLLADVGYEDLGMPRYPAVADGYWYLLAPLSAGRHDLVVRSSKPEFDLDVTFHLTVR